MRAILYRIWLQSNPVETSHQMNEQVAEIESHYLIPAVCIILVISTIAGIAITAQKHRRH